MQKKLKVNKLQIFLYIGGKGGGLDIRVCLVEAWGAAARSGGASLFTLNNNCNADVMCV